VENNIVEYLDIEPWFELIEKELFVTLGRQNIWSWMIGRLNTKLSCRHPWRSYCFDAVDSSSKETYVTALHVAPARNFRHEFLITFLLATLIFPHRYILAVGCLAWKLFILKFAWIKYIQIETFSFMRTMHQNKNNSNFKSVSIHFYVPRHLTNNLRSIYEDCH
jgi:hypothetical protein